MRLTQLRLPTRLALALPLTAALTLTACGGSDSDSAGGGASAGPSAASTDSNVDLAALVRAAPAKAAAQSVMFTFGSTTTLGDKTVAIKGEGAYDPTSRAGSVAFDVPGSTAAAGRIEERLIGDDVYIQLPQQAGVFFKVPLKEIAGTSLGNTTDPSASLAALLGVADVRKTGTGSVRGVDTTVYEGSYDLKAALAKAQGLSKELLTSSLKALGDVTTVPFTLQLDDQDRPVSFGQTLTLPQGLKSTTTLEFFDFGAPVTVAAPSAASVRDGAPLLDSLKRLSGRASAAASPAAPAPSPTS